MKKALKLAIENLVGQEARLLRLERIEPPPILIEEVALLIRQSKREVMFLTQSMTSRERMTLVRRMIREAMDEEIEQALRMRKNRCLRCTHVRYYDREGTPYVNLPVGIRQPEVIGCDELRAADEECRRFLERTGIATLEDYLGEITLLYDLRETLLKVKKIWEDYLDTP